MVSVEIQFEKLRPFLICVDSDGCVMDSMEVKHRRCFGPCLVAQWGLEDQMEPILRRWNELNLYSRFRGIHRFRALGLLLGELTAQGRDLPGAAAFAAWAQAADTLTEAAVARQRDLRAQAGEQAAARCFQNALLWSQAVNRAIKALPPSAVLPFSGAREGLAAAQAAADVAVVSGANRDAVLAEWSRYGLDVYPSVILAQDAGSKRQCIAALLAAGHDPAHVLMVGDAPGDLVAALANGVGFFPILARQEADSWAEFRKTALPQFLAGTYTAYGRQRILRFKEALSYAD